MGCWLPSGLAPLPSKGTSGWRNLGICKGPCCTYHCSQHLNSPKPPVKNRKQPDNYLSGSLSSTQTQPELAVRKCNWRPGLSQQNPRRTPWLRAAGGDRLLGSRSAQRRKEPQSFPARLHFLKDRMSLRKRRGTTFWNHLMGNPALLAMSQVTRNGRGLAAAQPRCLPGILSCSRLSGAWQVQDLLWRGVNLNAQNGSMFICKSTSSSCLRAGWTFPIKKGIKSPENIES